jgi:hypothetical protein
MLAVSMSAGVAGWTRFSILGAPLFYSMVCLGIGSDAVTACARVTHSPYLFTIVADLLQHIIRRAWEGGLLSHPISSAIPPPVLQYADDTLILCKADNAAVAYLRNLLNDFAAATVLAINFHKSCFIPMNVSFDDATAMVALMGCPISSLPQPYLGLPLSPTKLQLSAYAPLLQSFDHRLLRWSAALLSSGGGGREGHLTFCNMVLNNLATYYMCSYLPPRGVIESFDKRRCAFFWTSKDSCLGARCLIAWDKVLLSKKEGGFSVRDLHRQGLF